MDNTSSPTEPVARQSTIRFGGKGPAITLARSNAQRNCFGTVPAAGWNADTGKLTFTPPKAARPAVAHASSPAAAAPAAACATTPPTACCALTGCAGQDPTRTPTRPPAACPARGRAVSHRRALLKKKNTPAVVQSAGRLFPQNRPRTRRHCSHLHVDVSTVFASPVD